MLEFLKQLIDDKGLVIIAVSLITLYAMATLENPTEVVNSALAGLFGVAVGRSLK